MSGPRASTRVQNKESQLREQQEREEALALSSVAAANQSFFACLDKHTTEAIDFDLPAEWTSPPTQKRQKIEGVDDDGNDEEEVAPRKVAKLSIPSYRVLRQNLYRPPLQRVLADPEECTACNCKPDVGCGPQCHNRLLYMECLPGQCPSMSLPKICIETSASRSRFRAPLTVPIKPEPEEDVVVEAEGEVVAEVGDVSTCCLNTAIQTRTFPQVEVFLTSSEPETAPALSASSADNSTARGRSSQSAKSKKGLTEPVVSKGYGLKICEAISRGTIIVEYLGEVITAAECLRRMKSYSQHDAFYFAGLDNGLMLDAKVMGSVARFANHSCAPTCLLQKWTVQGECRLVLVAGRDMQAGEEVTYNYHYFDDSLEGVRGMQRQKCMCGSANCCGTIGGRVTKQGDGDGGNGAYNRSLQELLDLCVAMQISLPSTSEMKAEGEASSSLACEAASATGSGEANTEENKTVIIEKKTCAARRHPPGVLRELLDEIKTVVTNSAALADVPSTRFYTSNTAQIVPQLELYARALDAALAHTQQWMSDHHTLTSSLTPHSTSGVDPASVSTIPLSRAQELLARAPLAVRLPEIAQLEALVRNALRAERLLADAATRCNPVRVDTTAGGITSSVTVASRIDWQEFVLAVKAVLTALPVQCNRKHVQRILLMYEKISLWARQTVSPLVAGASSSRVRRVLAMGAVGAAARAGAAGSSASSTGHTDEDFALFERLLDAYVIQPGKAASLAAADVVLTATADAAGEQEVVVQDYAAVVKSEVQDAVAEAGTLESETPLSTPVSVHISSSSACKPAKVPKRAAQPKPPKASADALSLMLPLLSDPFAAAAFLDERLTTYMEKLQLEEALNKRISKTSATAVAGTNTAAASPSNFLPAQEGIRTPHESLQALLRAQQDAAATADRAISADSPDSEDDKRGVLYCFCRLPEDCGESSVLTQCTSCLNWYHPQCVNAAQASLSAAMRQKDFTCPVCQHLRNIPSNFAFEPQSEWAHIKPTVVESSSKKNPNSGRKNPKLKPKAARTNDAGEQESQGLTHSAEDLRNDNEHEVAGGKRKRPAAPTPGAPISRNNPYSNITGLRAKTAPAIKARDYLTAAELEQALAAEALLEISASPASLLLRLGDRYLAAWRDQCTVFLSSIAVEETLRQLSSYTAATQAAPPAAPSAADRKKVVLQACVLQRCLELYFETRLIRLRDEPLCAALRQLAWMLSCATMLRDVTLSDDEPSLPLPHAEEGTESKRGNYEQRFPRHRPSAAELGRIVRCGAQLFPCVANDCSDANGSSKIANVGAEIANYLRDQHASVSAALEASQKCHTREAAPGANLLWDVVVQAGFVPVEEEFSYAKIRCLCRKVATAAVMIDSPVMEVQLPHVVSAQSSEEMCAAQDSSGQLDAVREGDSTIQDPEPHLVTTLLTADLSQDPSQASEEIPGAVSPATNEGLTVPVAADAVYCYCRLGDDGSPMVSCDCCEEWFHCGCVGYDSDARGQRGQVGQQQQQRKKKALHANAESSYLCISCCMVSGRAYPYAW